MGVDALDPIEPPPQGDMELLNVRRQYGRDIVLFGNLEMSDLENIPPARFEKIVANALRQGTAGAGRGFVLMPSAAPYGREITATTMANYETMVRLAQQPKMFLTIEEPGGGSFFAQNGLLFLKTDELASRMTTLTQATRLIQVVAGDPSLRVD